MDPITIREVVGWGSPAMERIYTHVSPEHLRAQMAKRTARAFPAVGETKAADGKPEAVGDLAAMGAEEIRALAMRLAEEMERRSASTQV